MRGYLSGDGDGDGDGDSGDGDGDGDGEAEIHGCTVANSMDLTAESLVVISDISAWAFPHNACIRISANAEVRWESASFTAHPLVGGVAPVTDNASIVTTLGANTGSGPFDLQFTEAGVFPYFCGIHLASMAGVIYVE